MPGLSLGPSIILGWNASIVALEVTVWLAIGSALNFWILSPWLFYGTGGYIYPVDNVTGEGGYNEGGAVVWPGGLNIYNTTGAKYSAADARCTAIGKATNNSAIDCDAAGGCVFGYAPAGGGCSGGPIALSSTMWLTMIGIGLTLIGSGVQAAVDVCLPDKDDEQGEGRRRGGGNEYGDERSPSGRTRSKSSSLVPDDLRLGGEGTGGVGNYGTSRSPSSSSGQTGSTDGGGGGVGDDPRQSLLDGGEAGGGNRRYHDPRSASLGGGWGGGDDTVVSLPNLTPHSSTGRIALRSRSGGGGGGVGGRRSASSHGEGSQRSLSRSEVARKHADEAQEHRALNDLPWWVGPLGTLVLGGGFVAFVQVTEMGMPAWGTVVTVIASMAMSYGLGALMATTAQNMAMPSAMVLQLIFGFLLPGQGEANIVSAAVSNAIVAQSLTLLNDFKLSTILGVRARDMLVAQIWGTLVGVIGKRERESERKTNRRTDRQRQVRRVRL